MTTGRPLAVFLAMSVLLHVGAWAALLHRSTVHQEAVFDSTPQTLAGDTLDIDGVIATDPFGRAVETPAPEPHEEPRSEAMATPTPALAAPRMNEPAGEGPHASDRTSGDDGPSQPPSPPPLFGAVGVRFAADLPTTFTRMFPQAASADPAWVQATFGSAGTAEVTLVLDDAGHLVGETVDGAPSHALRQGIERTLASIKSRTFTARAAVTKLRVSARIQKNDVHDGLHGDVFALSGGSFSGEIGTAFFALPGAGSGRRVDVELRMLR
jgi:hypothetical protein